MQKHPAAAGGQGAAWRARQLSPQRFERLILGVLAALSRLLLATALA